MPIYVSLLFVLTFVFSALAQSMPKSSANRATAQQLSSTSETYGDTLGMIKTWLHTEKNADLARLFFVGDSRVLDLATACQDADDEIAAVSFMTLQLLGKSESQGCADFLSRRQSANGGLVLGCTGDHLSDADFKRIEEWFAKKRTRNGYECGDPEEGLIRFDDAVIYALILEGSPRSKSALASLLRFEKACTGASTITAEILLQADSLIVDAKRIGHNLRFEPDTFGNAIRASAFFLPRDYRKDSSVELISYNKAGDRVLLEVSYHCGLLCGKGYYVVLDKEGTSWQYALIRMAWISSLRA